MQYEDIVDETKPVWVIIFLVVAWILLLALGAVLDQDGANWT